MKGSSEGKAAANPDRCERSRSRDVARPRGESLLPQIRQEEVQRDRRERSRSRDVARPRGEIPRPQTRQEEGQGIRELRVIAASLPQQMRCRDPRCNNVSFEVFVADPNRPQLAELICVACGTASGIDLERRLINALFRARASSSSSSSSSYGSSSRAEAQPEHVRM